MDHIQQLKKIRSDAIARMRTSPDFKLAGKLGLLIVELGETVDEKMDYDDAEERPPIPSPAPTSTNPLRRSVATAVPAVETMRPFETAFTKPKNDEFTDLASDKMIDELVAEIEGDVAELDAIMAEDKAEPFDETIGPFLKPDHVKPRIANGSTH
ncbi:MAG: hypothetical protein V3V02_06795 [Rhizobiaceae bacterium]